MGRRKAGPVAIVTPEDRAARARELESIERREEEERERARRNADFVQFTRRGMAEYRGLIDRSPVAAKLLVLMAERMDYQNALVCSSAVLEELTGLSRTTIYRAITLLREERWINVIKVGSANAYMVNSGVFWTSYGNRKHTAFNATILATSSEQPEGEKLPGSVELRRFPFLRKRERAVLTSEELPPPDQKDLDLQ